MRRFRILVVEDDPDTLDQIEKLLRRSLNVEIDRAESVDAAIAMIQASANQPYPLAILDFKLPKNDPSGYAEVDESICTHLTANFPDTIVSHITGFREDAKIRKHLDQVHKSWRPGGFSLDNRDPEFGVNLVSKTREALYGAMLEREVDELFRREPRPDGIHGRETRSRESGSVTNRIADLCLEIGFLWKHLNPATQERVKQFFVVNEEAGKVSVFLR